MYQQIINDINKLLNEKEYVVIAIDGRCGAGKTTLSLKLKETFNCNVIHMDDFFLRPVQRTKERYAEPGGNVDRERVKEEILEKLVLHKTFTFKPFSCITMNLADEVEVPLNRLTVIEGTYSFHPELIDYYDYKIFVNTDNKTQLERISKRNPDKIEMFLDKWIPLEEKYFEKMDVSNKCDYLLNT